MAINDLTNLSNVKFWLAIPSSDSDQILSRLISQVSRTMLDYMQRGTLLSQNYTDTTDGMGHLVEFMRVWPVTAVQSVTIDGQVIPQITTGTYPSTGWTFASWDGFPPGAQSSITLEGYRFNRGHNNIQIAYTAGYLVQNEAAVIAAPSYQIEVAQSSGPWAQDAGVTYASSGTALTLVASSPAAGQYALGSLPGVYQFAAADAGQSILISYSFTPGAIEDAAVNWVAERFSYRQRIGQKSKSLGGQETVSYDLSAIPAYVSQVLNPYRKVLPF